MASTSVDRMKWFLFRNFERVLVLVLVASLVGIHRLIEYKVAFLSFYYLPVIVAGFFLGRKAAVLAAVLIVALVGFFQGVTGLDGPPGFPAEAVLALVPWAGFLILTGYVVGGLAEHRQAAHEDMKQAYVTMLELLTFNLESDEKKQQGHSHRVADLATRLATAANLRPAETENVRVAALLHEVGPGDPRLLKLLARFPGEGHRLPLAGAVRGATDILEEYARYYEVVGDEWPIDHLGLSTGVKILAVADAFETLQTPTPYRPAFPRWTALEELERGSGKTFDAGTVKLLRTIMGAPERAATATPAFDFLRN